MALCRATQSDTLSQYPTLATSRGDDGRGAGLNLIGEGSHDVESNALRIRDATASICLSAASKAVALKLRTSLDTPPSYCISSVASVVESFEMGSPYDVKEVLVV